MLSIPCPTCKRVLSAPIVSGEHRVVCPGCNAAFAVVVEAGVRRSLSTSVFDQPPEWLTIPMEIDAPPALVTTMDSNVLHDEASIRSRRIDNAFWVGFFLMLGFMTLSWLFDENDQFGGWEFFTRIPLILFYAWISGGTLSFVAAILLTPKSLARATPVAVLRRMGEAGRIEESPPTPSEDPSLFRPKDPPA